MIMFTTIMMLFFLTTPLAPTSAGQVGFALGDKELITTILLSSGLVQGYVMGFVAGKMGEGSIAAGFKHAGALAAISLVTIYASSLFFPS
jgi:flagellar protein FlaJ